jgi:hypothetical protein
MNFTLHTALTATEPVTGRDSIVLAAPPELYAVLEPGGPRAIVMTNLRTIVRAHSERWAQSLGVRLHHADWWITDIPEEVVKLAIVHECDRCRAETDQTLAYMRDNPGVEMLVGNLYWCDPE